MMDDAIAEARAVLERHYGEPVMPVSRYCQAFETWARAVAHGVKEDGDEADAQRRCIAENALVLRLAVRKSNLLYRLLYLGEELRWRKCPEHNGHWSGCDPVPCPHGCSSGSDLTGWLPGSGPA